MSARQRARLLSGFPRNAEGLIMTGGGRKDLRDRGKYFLALPCLMLSAIPEYLRDNAALIALNFLVRGDGQVSDEEASSVSAAARAGVSMFVDSGCFTLAHEYSKEVGLSVPDVFMLPPSSLPFFERWVGVYGRTLRRVDRDLWGYVEIDFGCLDDRTRTRARCFEEFGLVSIPVFRIGKEPMEVFEELLNTYDRVCLAGTAKGPRNQRLRMQAAAFETWQRVNPSCYVHALGVGAFGIFSSVNFPSCDSSTFSNAPRYGLTCGYSYVGFRHDAHFVPKFPFAVNEEDREGRTTLTTMYGHKFGMVQHSIYNLGRKAHLSTLDALKRRYRFQ